MSQVMTVADSRTPHTFAEPLTGLRASYGSIVAGATALLGTALPALALAIVMTTAHPTIASLKDDFITLWICGMATTLAGAVVGGWIAGLLPGNPARSIGAAHGFLAWATAFIVASAVTLGSLGLGLRTGVMATSRLAAGDMPRMGMEMAPQDRGRAVAQLEAQGYTAQQATQIVASEQAGVPSRTSIIAFGDRLVGWSAGLSWSWFGTWFVSAVLATAAGAAATRRARPINRLREPEPITPGTTWQPRTSSAM